MCESECTKRFFDWFLSCRNVFKLLTIILNVTICFVGFGIVMTFGIGICSVMVYDLVNNFDQYLNIRQCYGLVIIVGIFMIILAIYSLFLVSKNHICQLFISVIFYFFMAITLGAMLFHTWYDKQIYTKNRVVTAIRSYDWKSFNSHHLDRLQNTLSCCGYEGAADYHQSNNLFLKDNVPLSCCFDNSKSIIKCNPNVTKINIDNAYPPGCRKQLDSIVWYTIFGIYISLISILFLTFLTMGLLIILEHCSKKTCENTEKTGDIDVENKSENQDEIEEEEETKEGDLENEYVEESENENEKEENDNVNGSNQAKE